jgi:hypothetical protein
MVNVSAIEARVNEAIDAYPPARALSAAQRAAVVMSAVSWCSRRGDDAHELDPFYATYEATDAALQKAEEKARHHASLAEIVAAHDLASHDCDE